MNYTKTNALKLLAFILLLIVSIPQVYGQGTIKGTISSFTGESLPGANIYIKEQNLGTTSNLKGEFVLNNVPEGIHNVSISFLGFKDQEITIDIGPNETKTLDVVMELLTVAGAEIVITAQTMGQRSAINQQYNANTIKNVVSSEKIEELPDANAAEAIGRLPGISLKRNSGEANKIVIRGLSPKYNNVTIEGIKMASTSDFDRSVDLSLVQSESLGGIEVSKSLRPDMDADALGGTVNLRLLEAPDERKIDLVAEGGYAGITNDFRNYKLIGGISDRLFSKKIGASLKISYEQKQMPSHRFNGGYSDLITSVVFDDDDRPIDTTFAIRTNNVTLIEQLQTRRRTNGTMILDYNSNFWNVKFFNLFSQKNDDVIGRNNQYLFNSSGNPQNYSLNVSDTKWRTMTRTHTLQNTFRFGSSKLDIDLSTTYAESRQNDQNFPFVEVNDFALNQNYLINRHPEDIMDEIGGAESLQVEDTYLQAFNIGEQELIDESYDLKFDYELDFNFSSVFSGKLQLGGKYHQLERTSDGTSRFSDFQWGGSVARRQAFLTIFPDLTTDINSQRGISAHNFVDKDYDPGEFLNGRYGLGWTADVEYLTELQSEYNTGYNQESGRYDSKYYTRGVESFQRDYTATENLTAGYIMSEVNIGRKIMLLPGIRYEKNETEYFAFHIQTNSGITGIEPNPDSVTTNRSNEKWFPSINAKFKITDYLNIQGAYYKSTSRPSFRRISPLVIYPSTGNNITSNNPWLEPSTATNYDLGVSVMKPKIGLLTVFGFYKEIDDLIFIMNAYKPNKKGLIVGAPEGIDDRILGAEYYDEAFLNTTPNATTNIPVNNSEKAYIRGLEFSWQTSFWYLPGLLRGLVLDVNYSLIDTRTKYPYFQAVVVDIDSSGFVPQPIYGQQYRTRSGPMEDQPSSILNIILGWDYKGFSGRISYRYQDKTVESLDALHSRKDSYYDTFTLIDVMLKQKITESLSAYVNVTNIGNHIDDYFFGEQIGQILLPTSSQFYGSRIQVGLRFKL